MRIVCTEKFKAMLEKFPLSVQATYAEQERLLRSDLRHPRLHMKKLHGMDNTYSFRITRSYRALFVWEDDTVWLFAVGNRKDIYR